MRLLLSLLLGLIFYFLQVKTTSATIILEQDTAKKNAYYFVSNRNTSDGNYAMYKARTNQSGISSTLIRGNFEVLGFPHMRKAEISVYNISTDELVGVYNTNNKTGNYLIILMPNLKYEFVINSYGYAPIKKIVEIPSYASTNISDELSKQQLTLSIDSGKVNLSVNTWFVEEKEPTLFLLTVYDENNEMNHKVELYETNEVEEEVERRQLTETDFGNIDEVLKKQAEQENKKPELAEKAFLRKDYKTASEIYSQLLSLDAYDTLANYRKGVSLFFLEQNKLKALPYLQKAEGSAKIPYDIYYYLGIIYHSWTDFAKAEMALNEFKTKAKQTEVDALNINKLIQNCISGKALIQDQFDMFILNKTPIDIQKLNKELPTQLISEKFFEKTSFFISPIDAKKKEKMWMFKTEQNEMIQTSFGLDEKNGKDLFVNTLMGGDKWSIPKSLGNAVNTNFDEDYAYVTLDGKTLYFASKGHNSMGGYDVFMATRKTVNDDWGNPKNMGYPINSPYDDFLFMPSLSETEAYFVSNRRSPTGGYNLYKINMPKPALPLTIIKGHFMTNDSIPNFSASIAVYNTNNEEVVGIYNSNANTGNFLMALIPGVKYEFNITADGFNEHTAFVTVPIQTEDFPLRQSIKLKKEGAFEILNIDNYFTKEEAEKAPEYKLTKKDFEKNVPQVASAPRQVIAEKFKKASSDQQKIIDAAEQFFINKQYLKCAEEFAKVAALMELSDKHNYMYGKSLFNATRDYEKTIEFLEKAALNKTTPYDVYYMLGKTNHLSYRFERAAKAYEKYKSFANEKELATHDIENEMSLSMFGKKIVNNPKPIEVTQNKTFNQSSFHNIYGSLDIEAKFLLAPDDMTSTKDKAENFKPTMYLNNTKTLIYYSSYGENGANGKDLFFMKKLPNNTWSEAINVGAPVNTSADEDFPFLSKDETTLYFSSKAHGSMGGYDIFKSTWDEKTNSWSTPVNMGAPINSPFDDIFYVEE